MELNHDWRGFQEIFHPYRRRDASRQAMELSPAVFAVVDGETVLALDIGGEDATQWIGQPLARVTTELPGREIVIFDRKQVNQWLNGALPFPHFYEQLEQLRGEAMPKVMSAKGAVRSMKKGWTADFCHQHFLLEAIETWWSKIVPSAYGLFIRLEPPEEDATGAGPAAPVKEIFLLIRRGRIDLFHTPDLSGMGADRSSQRDAVVKYLSQRHMVPVQGLFVREADWVDWSEPETGRQAWRKMAVAIQSRRAKLIPKRWQVMSLIASRGFLKV